MKRKLSMMTALLLAVSLLFSACGNAAGNAHTETTEGLPVNIMQKSDPTADDTINVLMIGSSFCYYYVEELYGMLKAAGIEAHVYNVYYSGCRLERHWNWWKNGEANYELFITNAQGRKRITQGASLEYCLTQENWDVISL